MFKRRNKEGWVRVVEAFVAILVIAVVVLIVIQQDQNKRGDVASRIHNSITNIIREVQLDNNVRSEIISTPDLALSVEWQEFNDTVPLTLEKIIEETPEYLECVGKICSPDDPCLLGQNPDYPIYAESVIISSDLETYNPRVLKIFCWESEEEGGTGFFIDPTCGNDLVEQGEQCDDGGTVSGDGCSSTCQIEAVCGNDVNEPGEQCDDGNTNDGDGCSSTCQNEESEFNYGGCQEITSPGTYIIEENSVGVAPEPCLYIHDTSEVFVDCQGFNLTVPGLVTGQTIVKIENVVDFSLRNCVLPVTSVPGSEIPQSLQISDSGEGEINSNTFSGGSLVNVGYSWNLEVVNNIFNRSAYQQALTSYARIEGNLLDFNYSGAALILANDGEGNIIRGNTMRGYGAGTAFNHVGFDSGIIFDGQDNIEVTNNNITGAWNCGISMLGLIQNSIISDNNITNASFCGIGGWYWISLQNNVFANNRIDKSGPMFTIYRRYALKPTEQFVYFTDNDFLNNILTNKVAGRNYATDIDMNRSNWGEVPDSAFVSSNATFTSNNFGTAWPGPYISPRSAIIDGGGNICGPPSLGQGTSPLVCN